MSASEIPMMQKIRNDDKSDMSQTREGLSESGIDEVTREKGGGQRAGGETTGPYGGLEPLGDCRAGQASRCRATPALGDAAAGGGCRGSGRGHGSGVPARWWLIALVVLSCIGGVESRASGLPTAVSPPAAGSLLPRDRSGHADAVWQDHVFPLPRSSTTSCGAKVSRGTRQRINAEAAVQRRVDEVTRGLNWMSGRHGTPKQSGWSSAQLEVKELVETRVRRRGGPGTAEPGEAVLRAMTKGRSDYGGANLGAAVARYRLSEVSLPDDVRDAPFLRQLCTDKARDFLDTYRDSMLRPQAEYDALDSSVFVEPYMDPILRGSRRKYKELLSDLDRRGLIYWSATCRERCAIFFVKKKTGKLRLIIDARRGNLRFRDPPGVDLCSAECLGRLEIDITDGDNAGATEVQGARACANETCSPSLGMVDVKDCFLRMLLGGELSEYFALPALSANEARDVRATAGRGAETTTEEFGLVPDGDHAGEVFPCLRCLPMGFAWSLWFAQNTNEHLSQREPLLSAAMRISDRGPPPVLRPSDSSPKH